MRPEDGCGCMGALACDDKGGQGGEIEFRGWSHRRQALVPGGLVPRPASPESQEARSCAWPEGPIVPGSVKGTRRKTRSSRINGVRQSLSSCRGVRGREGGRGQNLVTLCISAHVIAATILPNRDRRRECLGAHSGSSAQLSSAQLRRRSLLARDAAPLGEPWTCRALCMSAVEGTGSGLRVVDDDFVAPLE